MGKTEQKQITTSTPTLNQTKTQQPLPQKIELTQPPQKTEQPTPQTQQTQPKQPEYKPIPQETKILLEGIEEIEGILYAIREKIWQLYGPRDYSNITDIELKFTTEQANKLHFELNGDHWIIKPKVYLGTELFGEIAQRIRELGGEYISAGKESHFKIKRS